MKTCSQAMWRRPFRSAQGLYVLSSSNLISKAHGGTLVTTGDPEVLVTVTCSRCWKWKLLLTIASIFLRISYLSAWRTPEKAGHHAAFDGPQPTGPTRLGAKT